MENRSSSSDSYFSTISRSQRGICGASIQRARHHRQRTGHYMMTSATLTGQPKSSSTIEPIGTSIRALSALPTWRFIDVNAFVDVPLNLAGIVQDRLALPGRADLSG